MNKFIMPKSTEEILLNELNNSNDWFKLSSYYNFKYYDLVIFINKIIWYAYIYNNDNVNKESIYKLIDNNLIDINKFDNIEKDGLLTLIGDDEYRLKKYKHMLLTGKTISICKFSK